MTMQRYAVRYANFFDNDLTVEIIEASDEREAILKHSGIPKDEWEDVPHVVEGAEGLKQFFLDDEILVGVIAIPDQDKSST